jgi:hypothetical protein
MRIEELLEMVFSMRSIPGLYSEHERGKLVSCEPVAIQQGREYGSKGIYIVGSRYQETTVEDIEVFMFAAVTVIFRVCKLVRLL